MFLQVSYSVHSLSLPLGSESYLLLPLLYPPTLLPPLHPSIHLVLLSSPSPSCNQLTLPFFIPSFSYINPNIHPPPSPATIPLSFSYSPSYIYRLLPLSPLSFNHSSPSPFPPSYTYPSFSVLLSLLYPSFFPLSSSPTYSP